MSEVTKVPIRGWLMLFVILLWVTAILSPIIFIVGFFTHPVGWYGQIYNVVVSVLSIATLRLCHQRRRTFVPWMIAMQVLDIIYYPGAYLTASEKDWWSMVLGAVLDVLTILYFVKSQRVKYTFVRE